MEAWNKLKFIEISNFSLLKNQLEDMEHNMISYFSRETYFTLFMII
jgi:hypothetical protein